MGKWPYWALIIQLCIPILAVEAQRTTSTNPLPIVTTTPTPVTATTPESSNHALTPIELLLSQFARPVYEVAHPVADRILLETPAIRLRRFEIYPDLTQFERTEEPFGAVGFTSITTYAASYDAIWQRQARCQQEFPRFLPELTLALQHYVQQSKEEDLLPHVASESQVSELSHADPRLLNALMPPPEAWQTLSDNDYRAYMRWISSCIGVSFPIFEVELENLTDERLQITQILYRTSDLAQVSGAEYGPLISYAAYVHEIDWIKGDQAVALVPPLELPPQFSTSFLLGLTTTYPEWGLCWLMNVYFIVDPEEGAIKTDEFQLIMSGLPVP